MKASLAIQVLPKVENTSKLIEVVDLVIDYLRQTGHHYHVGPFETTLECEDPQELFEIIRRCHEIVFEAGIDQVSCYIKTVCSQNKDILGIDEKISKHQHPSAD